MNESKIAILGGGNIGLAIMNGLTESKIYSPQNISITRENIEVIEGRQTNQSSEQ